MTTDEELRAFDDGSWHERASYCPACGRWVAEADAERHDTLALSPRLWVYTNYDCNLACSYCLVSSSPLAERRALGLPQLERLLEEARALGIREVFLTGGEPFLLPDIFAMIERSVASFRTTVLTNAMLLRGKRLEELVALNCANLCLQVSLDDERPGEHDAYRGEGSWDRAIGGVRALLRAGVRVRIATTVTEEVAPRVEEIRRFVRDELGIAPDDHIVRPQLMRGFSDRGLVVGKADLLPELTVDVGGVYWHPAGTDGDLLVTRDNTSLRGALAELARSVRAHGSSAELQPFR